MKDLEPKVGTESKQLIEEPSLPPNRPLKHKLLSILNISTRMSFSVFSIVIVGDVLSHGRFSQTVDQVDQKVNQMIGNLFHSPLSPSYLVDYDGNRSVIFDSTLDNLADRFIDDLN